MPHSSPLATRQVGQQSVFTATFTNDDGELEDPASVTFMWKVGSSEQSFVYGTDGEVTQVSVGVFEFMAPVYDVSAQYHVRVKSEGLAAAEEATILVTRSAFNAP